MINHRRSADIQFAISKSIHPKEDEYHSLEYVRHVLQRDYLSRVAARKFMLDLLRSGMIQAQGTPKMVLKPSADVMRNDRFHKVASEPSAWELEPLARPQSCQTIAVSFWKSAIDSYTKFPIDSVEVYIHSDYDADSENWDSSGEEIPLNTDTHDGSVAVYEDVLIRWGDIEPYLAHDAMVMPYNRQGISAFHDSLREKRSGRPLGDKWKDWAAEVAASLVSGRVWPEMTAHQFAKKIEEKLLDRGIDPIGITVGYQAAKTVILRLRSDD